MRFGLPRTEASSESYLRASRAGVCRWSPEGWIRCTLSRRDRFRLRLRRLPKPIEEIDGNADEDECDAESRVDNSRLIGRDRILVRRNIVVDSEHEVRACKNHEYPRNKWVTGDAI